MYTVVTGDPVADAQVAILSAAEFGVLMEVYDALRLAPWNGRPHVPGRNMHTWDFKGISVTYFVLEEQREVAVVRVDRFPV